MIQDFLFFLFAGSSVLGALFMVTRRNPVASVMWLIVVFFSLSGMFLLLEAPFIAALQVILYAGAIMVLFLFVVMLLNLGHASWSDLRGPLGRFLAGAVGLALLATVTRFLLAGPGPPLGEGGGSAMRELLLDRGAVAAVAAPLFEQQVVAFLATGLLLLVAMIGAIVLARKGTS